MITDTFKHGRTMTDLRENLSRATVILTRAELRIMLRLVRLLDRLSRDPDYRQHVYQDVPQVAAFDPGHDAVMMCYDFHLTGSGPKLIEVNTNAGGGLLGYLARDPALPIAAESIDSRLRDRLLQTFAAEIQQFSGGRKVKPKHIVIVDEHPPEQYLYPEMCVFADLFGAWGVPAEIADPRQLQASSEGVWFSGHPVDLVYNRHCDFYLEGEAMSGLRDAYLSRKVCLSPNPHLYGLLADKRRFVLWTDPAAMESFCLSAVDRFLLENTLSKAALLADLDLSQVWATRKQHVFKPVDSFGSRGVLLGEKISRKRFDELPIRTTLVQDLVPPSITEVPGKEPMKTDLRLYAYRDQVLGVTARLYRGQVTNMRTPGGGFARIKVLSS
jgi:hypothetical protein